MKIHSKLPICIATLYFTATLFAQEADQAPVHSMGTILKQGSGFETAQKVITIINKYEQGGAFNTEAFLPAIRTIATQYADINAHHYQAWKFLWVALSHIKDDYSGYRQFAIQELLPSINMQLAIDLMDYISTMPTFIFRQDMVDVLMQKFPELLMHKQPHSGETWLHNAARFNKVDLVHYLLVHGVDPLQADRFGKTALDNATDPAIQQIIKQTIPEKQRFCIVS